MLTRPSAFAQTLHSTAVTYEGNVNRAGQRISRQVTGTRKDAHVEAHRMQVDVDKPSDERGQYLFPELFGQSASKSIIPATTAAQSVSPPPKASSPIASLPVRP